MTTLRKFLRPGLTGKPSWQPLYEMARQPRYTYEIVTAPVGLYASRWPKIREAYAAQRPGAVPLFWPDKGIFMWTGYAKTGRNPEGADTYDPLEEREAIFTAVRNLDADQPEALLAFVNQWGVLGLGNPVTPWAGPLFPFDGVAAMTQWVRSRQAVLSAYMKLRVRRPGRWADVANVLGPSFRAGVYALLQDQNRPVTQPLLAEALNYLVGSFPHRVMAAEGQYRPVYGLGRLADLINLELWYHVTLGKEFRRCQGCQDAFIPSRPNQAYHSSNCGNKTRQQRWRDTQSKP